MRDYFGHFVMRRHARLCIKMPLGILNLSAMFDNQIEYIPDLRMHQITCVQGWNCRGEGVEPPVHVYRRSFLSENRL